MADRHVDTAQGGQETTILAGGQRRHASGTRPGPDRDGNAGSGVLGVARPWIVRVGVDQVVDAVQQGGVGDLRRVVVMQVGRDGLGLDRIDQRASAHDVGAGGHRGQVHGEPVGVDTTIGVGGQQDPVGTGEFRGKLHGLPARGAGMRRGRRVMPFGTGQAEGEAWRERAGDADRGVGAVVQQQDYVI